MPGHLLRRLADPDRSGVIEEVPEGKRPLKNRLRNEIDWDEKCFRRYGGRCAFLNDDNLCDLYLEGGGAKAFCRTCQTYPRHIEEFEGLREISLSLSCPAVAEIILGRPEPVRFLHAEDPDKGEPQPDAYDDFDYFLFTKLEDAREVLFQILQDRAHPVTVRVAAALAFAHDLQERIDHGALYDADRLLERYKGENVWSWFENRLELLTSAEDHAQRRRETLGGSSRSWTGLKSFRMTGSRRSTKPDRSLQDAAAARITRKPVRTFPPCFLMRPLNRSWSILCSPISAARSIIIMHTAR